MVEVLISINDVVVKSTIVTEEEFPATWYEYQMLSNGMWNGVDTLRVSNRKV